MRAGIGLLALLIAVAIIAYLSASHSQVVLKEGGKAHDQISQIAGRDAQSGERASDSAKLEGLTEAGKLRGILASDVKVDGAYAHYFGLKENDTIVGIEYQGNRQNMKDFSTAEDAIVQVAEAYSHAGKLYVTRDEKDVELPAAEAGKPEPVKSTGTGLSGQLDAIQNNASGR